MALHAAGRLVETEEILKRVLRMHPRNPYALHLLGVVAHQCGKTMIAAQLIARAIGENDQVALFHANQTEILRQLRQLNQAIRHGERATQLDPRIVMGHCNLGVAYFDAGRYDDAEASQIRALAIAPDFAPALNSMGSLLRTKGDHKAALEWYRKAASAHPDYLEPLANLGALLLEEDRIEEARTVLNRALKINPDFPEAVCNLGGVQLAEEEHHAALASFERALALRPNYIEAQMGLARTLQAMDRLPEAEAAARCSLAIDTGNAKAHVVLAGVLAEKSLPVKAETEYLLALEADSECDDALLGMGHLCVENGDIARAESFFQPILARSPDHLAARIHLAHAKKVCSGDENFLSLQRSYDQLASLTLPESANRRLSLEFALGKSYDDIGDANQAFPHFLEGCRLKRARLHYDAEATARQFDEIKEIFSAEMIARLTGSGDSSVFPIFVLGMPRSGTTLTEQIIVSHPDVHGGGELPDLLRIAHRRTAPDIDSFPANLRYLDPETLTRWGAEYVQCVRARAPVARRITDKMPANFFAVGLIHLMLPNARIIHVNRNPVDTCLSCFTHLFNRKQEHTYDLKELGRYYVSYANLMNHWRQVLPAGSFLDLCYEDLVNDQEGESRRLIEYCGLAWSDACLTFHKTRRQVRTASLTQVRQPVYGTSVERWRAYEKHLGPLLDALGNLVPERRL